MTFWLSLTHILSGSFITKYSAKPLSYQELDDKTVQTKFMVKLQLNLPWKPVLAWPWGVRCEIDPETNLIVLHEESWDIDALEVGFTNAEFSSTKSSDVLTS